MDRKNAERINQESQKNLCQTFQTEAAIDLACNQDRELREHFPQLEEILPPDLEDICEPRHLVQEEYNYDETETARPLSEREKRELFRQYRDWDIRSQRSWLVHYDTQEQDGNLHGFFLKRYVVQRAKHDLYRCHPVQECYHVGYV